MLFRDSDVQFLAASLKAVAQGLTVLDPSLASSVLITKGRRPDTLFEEMTPRELEVLPANAFGFYVSKYRHRRSGIGFRESGIGSAMGHER